MLIYSKKIIQFVNEIKQTIKHVLAQEIRCKVLKDRFYDPQQKASYPIKVVIYNNKSMLGYFNPEFYELGFHECLMHTKKEHLHHIIRHELAHYMTFILHGPYHQAHGFEFKAFCQSIGWDEEISKATTCLDGALNAAELMDSSILRKVKKLMALSTSSNRHEAEQAMIKSQQMLLMHNIDTKYFGAEDDEKVVLKRILKQKKENAKMRAIAKILETFFVSTVYNKTEDHIYLEILGQEDNIEIAEYVASVLQFEMEKLWEQAQRLANLKGMVAKNSFFLGIAKGYCDKIQALKREYNQEVLNALLVIENKLVDAKEMAYRRLRATRSHASFCQQSSSLGELMGRQLSFNPALSKTGNPGTTLIAYGSN